MHARARLREGPGPPGPSVPRATSGSYRARVINPDRDRAVYRRIAGDLRESIMSGRLAPGKWLPSVIRIQQEYGVGRETVRRALGVLVLEELVEIIPGQGTRVPERPPRQLVSVPRGSRWFTRRATPKERAELDLPEGAQVAVVMLGGRVRGTYPLDRTEFELR